MELVHAHDTPVECRPPVEPSIRALVEHVGRATFEILEETTMLMSFLGLTVQALGRSIIQPSRIRFTALISHMEKTGLDALPIVGLISFLIGVVLAYQGADQLRRFGAEIFVVNLIGVSILREIGILLTAIIIAGRSGSAFTASIGSMKVREEIDAMRTLGLDPMDVLVMPRLVALVLTLPMLAFFADMMGLLGGCLLAWGALGINPGQFVERLLDAIPMWTFWVGIIKAPVFAFLIAMIGCFEGFQVAGTCLLAWGALGINPGQFVERLLDAIPMWTFWVGIIKAPVFAFLIAMIGCFEGFQVAGSAESVGQYTTRAVVEAIFLVIVFDAAFSIMFAYLGI